MVCRILFSLLLLLQVNAFAKDQDKDEILCNRAPTVYIVGENRPSAFSENPCRGSAKIQGIAYECGNTMDTYTSTQKFFKENMRKAKAKCTEWCESISNRCTGHMGEQTSCGISIPTNRALETGRDVVRCPKNCKGQAFNYCSLYRGNYFSVEKELFKNLSPNCFCQRKI